jgi:protein-L-isoaspartate(D-aspartate) O-methyltransferase
MVNKRMQTLLTQLRQQGIRDEKLLRAIEAVPRERFVDEALDHKAYENTALPIGSGQTISQPYMVARMTELLNLKPTSRVLEIGTGSGYQTAILAHLVQHVCSVERIKGLQWQAKRRLKQLDLHNVSTRHGDGWQGWASRGPFDAIIVTAAAGRRRHFGVAGGRAGPNPQTHSASWQRFRGRCGRSGALCAVGERRIGLAIV